MTARASKGITLFWQILVVAAVIAGWELLVRSGAVNPILLASPSSIAFGLPNLFAATYNDLALTLFELFTGFALSIIVGVLIGLVMGTSDDLRGALFPYVTNVYALPKIILFPLFLLIFGFGLNLNIMFGFFHGIFPIALNTLAGMKQVKRSLIYAAISMGVSGRALYAKVIIPSMMPSLLTGFRLGLISTLVGVVVAEELVATGGMGAVIIDAAVAFEPARMYGAIALTAIMAVVVNQIMMSLQSKLDSWRVR